MARTQSRRNNIRVASLMTSVAASALLAGPALSQTTATVITPLTVQSDVNGVNVGNGRFQPSMPSLSVPAAPRLKFENLQNAVPYLSVSSSGSDADSYQSSVAVHTGASSSESFTCSGDNCHNLKADGAQIDALYLYAGGPYIFTESQSGAIYSYDLVQYDDGVAASSRKQWHYASSISYPDGEQITFNYNTHQVSTSPKRIEHRLASMSSNLGYYISFEYESNTFNYSSWQYLRTATLYKAGPPAKPLKRLRYPGNGTIIDEGFDTAGSVVLSRTYACSGCNNGIRSEAEAASIVLTLPGEGSAQQSGTAIAAPQGFKALASTIVRDGVIWSYTYNNLRAKPAPADYTYDSLVVTGPNGYQKTYSINSVIGGGPNLVASSADALGRTTSYQYDANYRPTRITQPEGNYAQIAYDAYGNITSKTSQPKAGSGLASITESASIDTAACNNNRVLCFRPTWYRDGLNRQTGYVYDAGGRLTQRTDPADSSGYRRVTYLTYGSSLTAPTVVRMCYLGWTCGTSAEIRTEFTYLGSTALPLSETRVDGTTGTSLTTFYGYDDAGHLLSENGPLPGTSDVKYFRYDAFGRKTWEIGPANANGTRPATRYYYRDSDDKIIITENGWISDESSYALQLVTRDDTNYTSTRNPVRVVTTDAQGAAYKAQSMSWDNRGQLVCSTVRMNPATYSSPPDACTLGAQGSAGPDRITRNIYDNAGQLLQVQKAYGTALVQNYATYSYSANGKMNGLTDANGNLTWHGYDGFDRLTTITFPSKTTPGQLNSADSEGYGYDAAGNRVWLKKRDGVTLTYQYDGMNRNTMKSVPASASGAAGYSVHYGYDVRGLQTYARFGSASGQGVTNVYDGYGRVTSSTNTMGGTSRTLSYLYDAAGNRTRVTHPDGIRFDVNYDAGNRMVNGTWTSPSSGTQWLTFFNYDSSGRRTQIQRGSGYTTYGHDGIGRLNDIRQMFYGGGNSISTFGYNPGSQIVTRARDNDDYRHNSYVATDRPYAANGLNQYASVAGATYGYDANGNLTSDGGNSYVYDAENRLVSASLSGGTSITYDPLGRLWQTYSPSHGTTQFLYDGDKLAVEYDGANAIRRRFAWGPGVDEPLLQDEGSALTCSTMRFLYADHQGSIIASANCGANRQSLNTYDEYGVPGVYNWGRFGYTGQAWLPDLGMYYYKARIYSPMLGRFLQTDPIGYEDQMNLYAYVGNDPMNSVDPSGMCTGSLISNDDGSCKGSTDKGASSVNKTLAGPGSVEGPVPGQPGSDYANAPRNNESAGRGIDGSSQNARAPELACFGRWSGVCGRVLNDTLQRILPKVGQPKLPPGVSPRQFGDAAGFGRGLKDLPVRSADDIASSARRLEEMKFTTRDVANWRNFYQDVYWRNPSNLSAQHRIDILNRIWWQMRIGL